MIFVNPIILTVLLVGILFGVVIICLASKLVEGSNTQQVAKGSPSKSKDEIQRSIRNVRIAMSLLILACVAAWIIGAIIA